MAGDKDFVLDNSGFSVKDLRYNYSEVEKLYYHRVQVQKTMNFVAAGIDHQVTIGIYVRARAKPLIIEAGPKMLSLAGFSFGEKKAESLTAKFSELSQRTFDQRVQKYVESRQQHGYFLYDGKKIHKSGLVEGENWSFNLAIDRPVLKAPFAIFYEKKGAGFLGRAKQYEIQTTHDADVFFALLFNLFRLRWA